MIRIQGCKGNIRHLLRILEDDVAMHVAVVRRRGPFVGGKGRELSRLVILVGDRDDCFQTLPATSGSTSSLMGSFLSMEPPRKR